MRMDKLTTRFQEALADAQSMAVGGVALAPREQVELTLDPDTEHPAVLRTEFDGVVDGDVSATRRIQIGNDGRVTGDLSAEHVGAAGGHGGADELALVHAARPALVPETWTGERAFFQRPGPVDNHPDLIIGKLGLATGQRFTDGFLPAGLELFIRPQGQGDPVVVVEQVTTDQLGEKVAVAGFLAELVEIVLQFQD